MADVNDMGGIPVDNLTQALLDNDASAIAWWSSENAKLRKEVERLQAQVAAARVALGPTVHEAWCDALAYRSCDCGASERHLEAIDKARRALGLEVSP